MTRGRRVAALLIGIWATVAAARPGQAQTPGDTVRPLVMPFQAVSDERKEEWLGELAAVALTRELRAAGVPAISREDRLQAMERLRVPSVPLLSHATVVRLASVVGASAAIVGRVEATAGELVFRARTIRVDTGHMAEEIVERGRRVDLFDVAARLGRRLVLSARPPGDAAAATRPPAAAFELFVRSLVTADPATKVRLLTSALEQAAAFDEARFELWQVYSDQGEHQRARMAVDVITDGGPNGRRAAFLGAVSELQLGRYPEASAGLGALHRARPDAAAANNMGIIQLRRPGPGPKAADLFREATTLDPEDADLFFNLGYAHWIAREYPQAVAALRDAVRRSPADDDAHYVLGAALQASGAADEGAREKDLARRLSSVYSELDAKRNANSVPRGLERLKTELDPAARTRVDSAIAATGQREQRELASFHLANGRRLAEAGRDADALAELGRAVFLSPYDSEAHLLIGRVLLRLGRAREAVDALKISIWSRDIVLARLTLAEAYTAAREYAAARAEAQAVLTAEPGNTAASELLSTLPPP
ncbi:MAG TPA: tetratricopeptide repeat protein [Vicinamibacterales bacterium]|nr:tetratricopeptide repeat protein [Vicinamibacterales bacterium]